MRARLVLAQASKLRLDLGEASPGQVELTVDLGGPVIVSPLRVRRIPVRDPLHRCVQLCEGVSPLPKQTDAQGLVLLGKLVLENLEGAPSLRRYEDSLPGGEQMAYEVRNRVALARAGRALNQHPLIAIERVDDTPLLTVGGQREVGL